MEVNKAKTKIMVFRKDDYLSKFAKWQFDYCNLEVVNEYCTATSDSCLLSC